MIRLYFGKSGAGKDYFLRQDVKDGWKPIVSYTTRPKRPHEVDGVDYHFVDYEGFLKAPLFEEREYVTTVAGNKETWHYGSPLLEDYKDELYVGVVDLKGAKKYLAQYGADNIEFVYVDASDELRMERAKKRGGFDQTEWDRRLADDAVAFSDEAIKDAFRYARNVFKVENDFEHGKEVISRIEMGD